jgi:23S rRNA (adenine2503-C2)-methyltransferase
MNEYKTVLSGLSLEELKKTLAPLPSFRAVQIYKWLARGALSFDAMTNLSLDLRGDLARRFSLLGSVVAERREDGDGTVKLRIMLEDSAVIEAVLLGDRGGRLTCCLSTQAGCPMGCVFCKTGSLGFSRSLFPGEILEQFYYIAEEGRRLAGQSPAGGHPVSNIVIMGMGEPLLNLENLRKALAIHCDARGTGFSKRRITLSSSGIPGGILELAEKGPETELAFSLNSAREDLRRALMPGAENSLEDIKKELSIYQQHSGRRITLEIVLLGGINTSYRDAREVLGFARGLMAVVNLIPWNPVEGISFNGEPLREPSEGEITGFSSRLEAGKLTVTQRHGKGRGICGACGQLGGIAAASSSRA